MTLSFNDYQTRALETLLPAVDWRLGPSDENVVEAGFHSLTCLTHLITGLNEECGEINKIFKKLVRDNAVPDLDDLKKELGDTLWFVSAIAAMSNIDLQDVAETNLRKLASRKNRNKLGGSGDNR